MLARRGLVQGPGSGRTMPLTPDQKRARLALAIPQSASIIQTAMTVSARIRDLAIYTHDEEQKPNSEVGLKGGAFESVRSLHAALIRREPFEADCDDFALTGCEASVMCGVPAERLWYVLAADETQITYSKGQRPYPSHAIGALGPAGRFSRDRLNTNVFFENFLWMFDTWDQTSPHQTPLIYSGGKWSRHLPMLVMNYADPSFTFHARAPCVEDLRRAGYTDAQGKPTGKAFKPTGARPKV